MPRDPYFMRVALSLKLDQGILAKVDDEYEKLTQQANAETIDASKRDFANLDAVRRRPRVIDALVRISWSTMKPIVSTNSPARRPVVAYSRPAAMAIYQRICELLALLGRMRANSVLS